MAPWASVYTTYWCISVLEDSIFLCSSFYRCGILLHSPYTALSFRTKCTAVLCLCVAYERVLYRKSTQGFQWHCRIFTCTAQLLQRPVYCNRLKLCVFSFADFWRRCGVFLVMLEKIWSLFDFFKDTKWRWLIICLCEHFRNDVTKVTCKIKWKPPVHCQNFKNCCQMFSTSYAMK